MEIKVLDCTLRDGGCVNQFYFGTQTMRRIFHALNETGVDLIELGYLDEKQGSPEARTCFDSLESVQQQLLNESTGKNCHYTVMIDYGKYPLKKLPPAKTGYPEIIRLCFHKKQIQDVMKESRRILEKGYQLYLQPMVNSRYTQEEFSCLLGRIARELPETAAVYLVDSFGCMPAEEIQKRILLADQLLPASAAIGLHTHNNRNQSLENAQTAMKCSLQRTLILDATLYGMGKGAGNLQTESILSFLSSQGVKACRQEPASEIIAKVIRPLKKMYAWGYCKEYELSADYRLTPSYAKLFYRQYGFSLEQTGSLLAEIPDESKDSYDVELAVRLAEAKRLELGISDPPADLPLLDARGFSLELCAQDPSVPFEVSYLGAVHSEHPGLKYDQDPYVTSHLSEKKAVGNLQITLKDSGILKSGLRLSVSSEMNSHYVLSCGGETITDFSLEADEKKDMVLDVTGLCGEEREYLDRIHHILYRLLGEIDRVTAQLGIRYYLVFGGLLGAVRHGCIIPWDDDVDIAMTRKDFEIFRKEAPKLLGEDFRYLDCSETGGFLDFMCRVLYMKEEVPGNVFRKVEGQCDPEFCNKLPLDIFILDKASDDPRKHAMQMMLVRGIYGLGMGHRAYVDPAEYRGRDHKTRFAVRILSKIGKLMPLSAIYHLHDKVCTMYEKKDSADYFMSDGYLPYIHTRYHQDWFAGVNRMRLGEMEINAPVKVTEYLWRAYYDYYHLPPVEKRVPSHSPKADGIH